MPRILPFVKAGWGIKKSITFGFFIIFVLYIIIQATVLSIQKGNITPVFQVVQTQLITPSLNIKNISQQIILSHQNQLDVLNSTQKQINSLNITDINQKTTSQSFTSASFYKTLNTILTYWSLISSIFYILFWVFFIMYLLSWTPFTVLTSAKFANLCLATFILWILQVFTLLWLQPNITITSAMYTPIQCWIVFGHAIYYKFTN